MERRRGLAVARCNGAMEHTVSARVQRVHVHLLLLCPPHKKTSPQATLCSTNEPAPVARMVTCVRFWASSRTVVIHRPSAAAAAVAVASSLLPLGLADVTCTVTVAFAGAHPHSDASFRCSTMLSDKNDGTRSVSAAADAIASTATRSILLKMQGIAIYV